MCLPYFLEVKGNTVELTEQGGNDRELGTAELPAWHPSPSTSGSWATPLTSYHYQKTGKTLPVYLSRVRPLQIDTPSWSEKRCQKSGITRCQEFFP